MVGKSIFLRWSSANGVRAWGEGNLWPIPSPCYPSFLRLSFGTWVPSRPLTAIPMRNNMMPPQTHGHDGASSYLIPCHRTAQVRGTRTSLMRRVADLPRLLRGREARLWRGG